MKTKQSQIINLPEILKKSLGKRADRFGVSMAFYIKRLIMIDQGKEYPKFEVSERTDEVRGL